MNLKPNPTRISLGATTMTGFCMQEPKSLQMWVKSAVGNVGTDFLRRI